MTKALVASALVLARWTPFCTAFVAPGMGSNSLLLSTPVVSSTTSAVGVAPASIGHSNWAAAMAGSDARRRGRAARCWRSSSSWKPLRMMAGECVGGTDISRVLFVCLYNIMTSPCAEGCLNKKILDEFGVFEEGEETWEVDSCGTGGGPADWYKEGGEALFRGQEPDPRIEVTAAQRRITTRGLDMKGGGSRPLTPADLDKFDVILGIDDDNVEAIMTAAKHWGKGDIAAKKTRSLLSYGTKYPEVKTIPNPYYAGREGFEVLVDIIQHAVDNLFEKCLRGEALSYD
ncbi:unnamed protein product [Ectocarpus sp. CCAP 1310/34]|nr:unnamed protein product [Ectocarpus sp. CCAP 1310/34]